MNITTLLDNINIILKRRKNIIDIMKSFQKDDRDFIIIAIPKHKQ